MSWDKGFDAMMGNPLFNLGLGILGANRYGDNWTRAVGEGGLAGIQSHRRNELLALQKERHQLEIDEAKRRAERYNAQKAAMNAVIGNPGMQAAGPPNPDGTMPQVGATGMYATNPEQAKLASALSPGQFAMAMFQQNNQNRAYDRRVLESNRNFDWQKLTDNRNHELAQAAKARAEGYSAGSRGRFGGKVSSPTSGDVEATTKFLKTHPQFKGMDEEQLGLASQQIASRQKVYQGIGLDAQTARKHATVELMISGNFTPFEEQPYLWGLNDTGATYNPYMDPLGIRD